MSNFLKQNFGDKLRSRNGLSVLTSSITAEVIGIYFSAHWCPGCKTFTPILSNVYNTAQKSNKSFEIIYVSHDRSSAQFEEYYKTMPWLALPFDSTLKSILSSKHQIKGIPTLILTKRDGTIISNNKKDVLDPSFINSLPTQNNNAIQENLEELIVQFISDTKFDTSFTYLSLKTITNVFSNIIKNPGVVKYLKLNKTSTAFKNKLNDVNIIKILTFCGFKETAEYFIFENIEDITSLKQHYEILTNILESFNSED
uniref:Transposase n=1 Tax=Nephromyces sp. MMRI TaxID=2496275 RepID=A0A3Q8UBS3_9APIC|nr:transposase [Nephromyces sp. MMRI]AZL94449.1 transposase [Nephromyces sp. MMRI]